MNQLLVVEYSAGPGTAYAGSLFAASGVGVVQKFSSTRRVGYGAGAIDEVLQFLDREKSVKIDDDESALIDALTKADVVITDDRSFLDRARKHAPSNAILGAITFDDGESSAVSDLLTGAALGIMAATGLPDREPLFGVGNRFQHAAGLYLFINVLLNYLVAPAQRAPIIEVDLESVIFCLADQEIGTMSYSGTESTRSGIATGPRQPHDFYRCKDGFVTIFVNSEAEWQRFAEAVGDPTFLEDSRLATEGGRSQHRELLTEHIVAWTSRLTRQELLDIGTKYRLACMPIFSVPEALELLQSCGINKSWQNLCLPPSSNSTIDVEVTRAFGPTAHQRSFPNRSRWKVADNEARVSANLPLRGLRVVEVTTAWAGPLIGRILAAAGAQVIKIESDTKWDVWRGLKKPTAGLNRYPDGKAPGDARDANTLFNTENRGKLNALVNLKRDEGPEIFKRLIAKSDVLIENLHPGALENLGLSFDQLVAVSPNLLMVSICAIGRSEDIVGWGSTVESLSGMGSVLGYPDDERPVGSGIPIVDPLTGLWGTSLLLSALYRGDGPRHIETSMVESVLASFFEPAIDESWAHKQGNGYPSAAMHGCFRTVGDDKWIVIACDTYEQLLLLAEGLRLPVPTRSNKADDVAEFRQAVADAVSSKRADELANELNRIGVPATAVRKYSEIFFDERYRDSGVMVLADHPVAGRRWYSQLPIRFGLGAEMRAPLLGEHNAYVWKDIAGLSSQEFDHLLEARVIG